MSQIRDYRQTYPPTHFKRQHSHAYVLLILLNIVPSTIEDSLKIRTLTLNPTATTARLLPLLILPAFSRSCHLQSRDTHPQMKIVGCTVLGFSDVEYISMGHEKGWLGGGHHTRGHGVKEKKGIRCRCCRPFVAKSKLQRYSLFFLEDSKVPFSNVRSLIISHTLSKQQVQCIQSPCRCHQGLP